MRIRKVGMVMLIATTLLSAAPSPKEKLPNLLPDRPVHLIPRPRLTFPRATVGLPMYDYVPANGWGFSQPISAVSSPGLLLPAGGATEFVGTAPLQRPRVKLYQLDVAQLQSGHCSVSRVAVTLHDNGDWILSLRADQNPWMTGPNNEVSTRTEQFGVVSSVRPPIPNLERQTNDLKRNLFVVRVRCFGAFPVKETQLLDTTGKPVLCELKPPDFWVQRGEPRFVWERQHAPLVRTYFDLIDRVEVEFKYR